MKSFVTGLLIGALVCGAAVWRFHSEPEAEKPAQEEKGKDHVEHSKDGEVSVKLEEEERQQMGLRTQPVAKAAFQPEIKAFGRVLNATDLPLLQAEITVAEVALKGSKAAFDRLKKLNGEVGNVSAQKVEEADEAMKKDEVAVQAARVKLMSAWGQGVAGRADLAALTERLAANKAALVRLDLPPGSATTSKSARLALPGNEDHPLEAEILGPAPVADPVTQSTSLICLVAAEGWTPGAAVIGFLPTGKEAATVSLPRSALLRHEGRVFVYQRHEDEFARVAVELQHAAGDAWLAKAELKAGDEIVVVGAQQLLAEELKGQTEED